MIEAMQKILLPMGLFLFPAVAAAQSLLEWLPGLLGLINSVVIPLLLAVAFLVFIWNAFRFFIFEGHSEEGRGKAKQLMIWGIAAFVTVAVLVGVVRLLTSTFGLGGQNVVCPDYDSNCKTQTPLTQTSDSGFSNTLPESDPLPPSGAPGSDVAESGPLKPFGGAGPDIDDDLVYAVRTGDTTQKELSTPENEFLKALLERDRLLNESSSRDLTPSEAASYRERIYELDRRKRAFTLAEDAGIQLYNENDIVYVGSVPVFINGEQVPTELYTSEERILVDSSARIQAIIDGSSTIDELTNYTFTDPETGVQYSF